MLVLCGFKLVDKYHGHVMINAKSTLDIRSGFKEKIEAECKRWDELKAIYCADPNSLRREPCWRRPTAAVMTSYLLESGKAEFR